MKKDIVSRDDIIKLIDSFYGNVKNDPKIGPIFSDIVKVDWDAHLPVMYSFWASVLIGEQTYNGNPMSKHIALSKITPMTVEHFDTWLSIFHSTLDSLYEGEIATLAKLRATNIAGLMLHKIETDK
jgi:hemoglobin